MAAPVQAAVVTQRTPINQPLPSPILSPSGTTSSYAAAQVPVALAPVGTQPSAAANVGKKPPVLLEADHMYYDHQNSLVIAMGHVEVTRNKTIVLADRVTYHQPTDVVQADGHVSILEEDGSVYFTDHMVFQRDMQQGIVKQFRIRMKNDSLFAAREADKINNDVTVLRKAVYSPCKICQETDDAPMWQFKANKATIDNKEQVVTYQHAFMEVYGIPMFYTPYMSHPTPDADAKPGFLTPSYRRDQNLGFMLQTPYYYPIAENKDIVATPIFSTNDGAGLRVLYRHMLEDGYFELGGSGIVPERRDALGNITTGREFRGHIEGNGRFKLNETWRTGFDLKRATDDTYLWRYRYSYEDVLTTRTFLEGVRGRRYLTAETLSFQGLQITDNSDTSAVALPYVRAGYESEAGWMGSRWFIDSSLLALTRDVGTNVNRGSVSAGWHLPLVTNGGQLFDVTTKMRVDGYDISDFAVNNTMYSGQQGRLIPEAEIRWRYPLQKTLGETATWVFEPTAGVALAPNGLNDIYIPNEDSQVNEFTGINLFSTNHFSGIDRVETGLRGFYGFRNMFSLNDGMYFDTILGQNYQENPSDNFPFTNSLSENRSDYVGRVAIGSPWANILYRFRVDQRDLAIRRSELSGSVGLGGSYLSMQYVYLDNDVLLNDRHDLTTNFGFKLNDEWMVYLSSQSDMNRSGLLNMSLNTTYTNECLMWQVGIGKDLTGDRDVQSGTSFGTRLVLRTFSE